MEVGWGGVEAMGGEGGGGGGVVKVYLNLRGF